MNVVDLRSDTVTKPSAAMREAMVRAEVGDDVYGEDPTVNRLQEKVAAMFGKEAALFVPSGTMGNEIAIKAHTAAGDEIIAEQDSHIVVYETGAPSLLAGVQIRTIPGDRGMISARQLKEAIRPSAYYLPKTSLICLENTHGRSGGSVLPLESIKALRSISLEQEIPLHLDGARIWNASVAAGVPLHEYASQVDSISACFSKGLGAPVGSILIGSVEFIDRCRKYRKIFGGGMRQAGILAAAALYALDHNISRLEEDHAKATLFAGELKKIKCVHLASTEVQSNMVIAEINYANKTQGEILNLLKSHGILMTPEGNSSIRGVTHLDVSMDDVKRAVGVFHSLFT